MHEIQSMEYCNGGTFEAYMDDKTILDVGAVRHFFEQIG